MPNRCMVFLPTAHAPPPDSWWDVSHTGAVSMTVCQIHGKLTGFLHFAVIILESYRENNATDFGVAVFTNATFLCRIRLSS